jgi:hypothetical protein
MSINIKTMQALELVKKLTFNMALNLFQNPKKISKKHGREQKNFRQENSVLCGFVTGKYKIVGCQRHLAGLAALKATALPILS